MQVCEAGGWGSRSDSTTLAPGPRIPQVVSGREEEPASGNFCWLTEPWSLAGCVSPSSPTSPPPTPCAHRGRLSEPLLSSS